MKLNIDIIEAKRKANGLSKEDLWNQLGISRQALSYIYKNERTSLETIEKLTKLFNLKVQELLIQ